MKIYLKNNDYDIIQVKTGMAGKKEGTYDGIKAETDG